MSVSKPVETPLVVIRGDATEEEVAALVAVLQGVAGAAAATAAAADGPTEVSAWAAPARKVRVSHPHGPGGWRASALPR